MKLIFDIGYNLGNYSKNILEKYPNCKIIGLEPNPFILPESFKHPNITLINKLVYMEDDKTLDFYVAKFHGVSTSSSEWITKSRFIYNFAYEPVTKISAQTVTLDTLIKTFGTPDFIKIDVEGSEFQVLNGLHKKQNLISFEWTEELFYNAEKCIYYLRTLGYNEFAISACVENENNSPYVIFDKTGQFFDIPNKFYTWETLKPNINHFIRSNIKNYGMLFAK